MFAYCNNNPVNCCDDTGCKPEYNGDPDYKWAWDLGWWIKEQLDDWREADEEKINCGQVTYQSKGTGKGATIHNSHIVTNPAVMIDFIETNRSNDIKGSTAGVVYEWVFHNMAYVATDALGLTTLNEQARNVDVGKTIYSDHRQGYTAIFSIGMKVSFFCFNPITAMSDLYYELE